MSTAGERLERWLAEGLSQFFQIESGYEPYLDRPDYIGDAENFVIHIRSNPSSSTGLRISVTVNVKS
jgi:hypothetical protein